MKISVKGLFSKIESQITADLSQRERQSLTFLILLYHFNIDKSQYIINPDITIDNADLSSLKSIIDRINRLEPPEYIFSKGEFRDLTMTITPEVLIPRPETEELVEIIINENKYREDLKILDICTGSGCIALSLANDLDASVYGIDISSKAIEVARKNNIIYDLNVHFSELDILNQVPRFEFKFDIIVSNPPYVMDKEKSEMKNNVLLYEPHQAIFVNDEDPIIFYKTISSLAKILLNEEGRLYFEINETQGETIAKHMINENFSNIKILKDMNDKDRFISAYM